MAAPVFICSAVKVLSSASETEAGATMCHSSLPWSEVELNMEEDAGVLARGLTLENPDGGT